MAIQSADPLSCGADIGPSAQFDRRLELFEFILGHPAVAQGQELTDHSQCLALSPCLRGKLCDQLAQLPPRHLRAGEPLYLMGNPARSLFLLQTGLVKTSVLSPAGQQLTLRVHKPGDILGELCLCGGGRRDQAIALEASTVTEIQLASLIGQLRRDPQAALELASLVCERLTDSYEQAESSSWDTVLQRLVRTLVRLAADFGETSPAGTQIPRAITQDELAQIVAARREVVSGLLSRLRTSGHISYTPRGSITIDRDALQAFLDARNRA